MYSETEEQWPEWVPCCTTSEDRMMSSPKKREDGEPHAERTNGSSSLLVGKENTFIFFLPYFIHKQELINDIITAQ